MSAERESLWPPDFGNEITVPPVTILREQAGALGEITKGVVKGTVSTSTFRVDDPEPGFYHTLTLVAPALGNYRYDLITVAHTIEPYPAKVTYLPSGLKTDAKDADELKIVLRTMFNDERTRRVIASLLAQSKA